VFLVLGKYLLSKYGLRWTWADGDISPRELASP
jgi:hypothetical protein